MLMLDLIEYAFVSLSDAKLSPAEVSPPIGALIELRSNDNLPCLVNLAINIQNKYTLPCF